jgi:PAS domain S-box-containing protein
MDVTQPDGLESERARLAEAERQQRILSEVSRALLDYVGPDEDEPLRRIVANVADATGDWCTFALVQPNGVMRMAAAHHTDSRQRELAETLNKLLPPGRWDAGVPGMNALVEKRPLVFEEIPEDLLRKAVPDEEAFGILEDIGLRSAVVAPMFDAGSPLGTMTLASVGPRGRRYTQNDLDFAYALAGRAALAVRNARLVRQIAEERDHQQAARVESERRFAELRAVIDSDPNGLALFDAEGKLQLASHRLEEIFGLPLRSMLGQLWRDIYRRKLEHVVSGDRDQLFARVQHHFEDRESRATDELELERPRHRWVTRTTVPVLAPDGEYLGRLFVYVDVTEQRELDRLRSDFLTVAAHELRTPLTPLSMYLQSMERKVFRQQGIEPELVGKARRQVGRLTRLVEDVLDVSRLESRRLELKRETIDLNELVDQVVGDFRAGSRQHEIIFRRSHELVAVDADHARIEQVLVNLLANAVKYSPQGGQIVVQVDRVGREARTSVADSGIGIPPDERKRLFQRFFRAHNVSTRHFGGLGIGLFVSNEIVDRHGGRFEVESEPGRGSTFTFYLPLTAAEAERSNGKRRVLLVDDDPEILEATGQALRELGYTVDEARDGVTALTLARGARPDVMLIDLMMPVMDGWTLIARLREEQVAPGVPLVVFSADRDAREKASMLSADAALRKPFALEELQGTLDRLLGQQPAA